VLDGGQVEVDPDRNGIAGRKLTANYPWFFNCIRQRKRGGETERSVRYPIGDATAQNPYFFGKLHIRQRR
jgi:hypothetical protein